MQPTPTSTAASASAPGSAIILAYMVFTIWGLLLGLACGWLIWA